ncbi:hypothetical protein BVRB_5g115400 [Beta vulgaris subsp. vulgaris]|nr:hypothetical protein BVRB_5g115400 [Beta vulgaris subsp. vulgaris]
MTEAPPVCLEKTQELTVKGANQGEEEPPSLLSLISFFSLLSRLIAHSHMRLKGPFF